MQIQQVLLLDIISLYKIFKMQKSLSWLYDLKMHHLSAVIVMQMNEWMTMVLRKSTKKQTICITIGLGLKCLYQLFGG